MVAWVVMDWYLSTTACGGLLESISVQRSVNTHRLGPVRLLAFLCFSPRRAQRERERDPRLSPLAACIRSNARFLRGSGSRENAIHDRFENIFVFPTWHSERGVSGNESQRGGQVS